jgi:hypothetical protein
LSISVDYDDAAWRSFLQKTDVPGLQWRDGYFGPVAGAFGVQMKIESGAENPVGGSWTSSVAFKQAIPRTFTIDAEGVLQAEKSSDSSLDEKLQELIARAGVQQAGR